MQEPIAQLRARVCPTGYWTFSGTGYFQIGQQAVAQLDCNQEHYSFLSKSKQTLKRFGALTSLKLLTQQFFQVAIPLMRVTRCLGDLPHVITTSNDMNFAFCSCNCRIEPCSIDYSAFLQSDDDTWKL